MTTKIQGIRFIITVALLFSFGEQKVQGMIQNKKTLPTNHKKIVFRGGYGICDRKSISDEQINFISQQKELEELDISGTDITDNQMKKLFAKNNPICSTLKKLCLNWCDSISDKGCKNLENLVKLQELHFCYCEKITDEGAHCFPPSIEKLYTHGSVFIGTTLIKYSSMPLGFCNLTRLKEFHYDACDSWICKEALKYFKVHNVKLIDNPNQYNLSDPFANL